MTNTNKDKQPRFFDSVNTLPEPQRSEAKAGFMEMVVLRLVEKVDSILSPEKADELEAQLERVSQTPDQTAGGSPVSPTDAMIDWFDSNVPNFSEVMDATITEVDAELASRLQGSPEGEETA